MYTNMSICICMPGWKDRCIDRQMDRLPLNYGDWPGIQIITRTLQRRKINSNGLKLKTLNP